MDHHHHHHHHHEAEQSLSFEEKLDKILRHWIRHNNDHSATYAEWTKQAEKAGLMSVAQKLTEASKLVATINELLEEAAKSIDRHKHP
ncbi:MAG: hypothetical protein ACOZF0_06865 [Thermodesulfobacteriota bacterium]